MKKEPKWLKLPQTHDYPAAEDYLFLIYPAIKAKKLATKLLDKDIVKFKAKDIFRASELPHLGKENYHVKKNISKIKNGEALSPILLVKDKKLIIADGYHRLCAVYIYNEDARIPCKITSVIEVD